jgi:hypothetical protein
MLSNVSGAVHPPPVEVYPHNVTSSSPPRITARQGQDATRTPDRHTLSHWLVFTRFIRDSKVGCSNHTTPKRRKQPPTRCSVPYTTSCGVSMVNADKHWSGQASYLVEFVRITRSRRGGAGGCPVPVLVRAERPAAEAVAKTGGMVGKIRRADTNVGVNRDSAAAHHAHARAVEPVPRRDAGRKGTGPPPTPPLS